MAPFAFGGGLFALRMISTGGVVLMGDIKR